VLKNTTNLSGLLRAVQENGFTIIFLTRLAPVFPYHLFNYFYGVTSVSFKEYFVATLLGLTPSVYVYCYIADNMKNMVNDTGSNIYNFIIGGIVSVVSIAIISVIIKKKIDKLSIE
jgi:uncharacterized membrane protein YdjX (TVP38/TMEM64 family)